MFMKTARMAGLPIDLISGVRYYIDDHKRGAFELGAPTTDVLDVTGRAAEDFETIARRYAAQPRNQRSLGSWLRQFAQFMMAPLSPSSIRTAMTANYAVRSRRSRVSRPSPRSGGANTLSPTLPSQPRRSTRRPRPPPVNGWNPNKEALMVSQLCFFVSITFSFIAWGIVTARHIWPELRLRQRAEALRPLLILHSFRFIGLAFLVPGVVSPDLPSAFAHSAAYGDIIAATLALLSLLSLPRAAGVVMAWIFNLWGSADLLNAFYQANHSGLLPGQLAAPISFPL
jgi:hypothetical protein